MKTHLTMDEVAQGLHVALGALFVMVPTAKGWLHPWLRGAEFGILYGFIKEFWWDLRFEDKATSGGIHGGVKDFTFYLVGIAVGLFVLIL